MKNQTDLKKKKEIKKLIKVFSFLIFFTPIFVLAQIEITEIMYDLEGSDSGREWIEIFNSGAEDIDLKNWRFVTGDTSHRINIENRKVLPAIVPSKSYAIFADNPDEFKKDNPIFSGTIFNGSFSLKNTSEILIIKNEDLEIDRVEYSKEQGASGDGNSLQKINGEWKASIPTVGISNFLDENPVDDSSGIEDPQTLSGSTTTTSEVEYIEPEISARIVPLFDSPIAGADFLFEAKAFGLENKPLENAEYHWAFGDGTMSNRQNVLHTYQYPSDYMVVLNVISGKYTASDRLKIKVIPSDIIISKIGSDFDNNFIELQNPSNYEFNLSWWRLKVNDNYFTIPKDTILLAKGNIKFSSRITSLFPQINNQVQLLYPNGFVAFNYVAEKEKNTPIKSPSVIDPISVKNSSIVIEVPEPTIIGGPTSESFEKVDDLIEQTQSANIAGGITGGPTSYYSTSYQVSNSGNIILNKWTLLLSGIILIAVIGIVYVTRLDTQQGEVF